VIHTKDRNYVDVTPRTTIVGRPRNDVLVTGDSVTGGWAILAII